MAALDPNVREQLMKTARLWALSLVCALAGAGTIWRTGSTTSGVVAFLGALVVLGPVLWIYEKRRG